MLTLELADRLATETLAAGARHGFAPLCVVVLDRGGHMLVLKRQETASNGRPQLALAKAAGCLNFGVGGRTLATMAAERPAFVGALGGLWPGGLVPAPGGLLLRDEAGELVGAIGVTGDVSDNDERCALDAAAAVGLQADTGG